MATGSSSSLSLSGSSAELALLSHVIKGHYYLRGTYEPLCPDRLVQVLTCSLLLRATASIETRCDDKLCAFNESGDREVQILVAKMAICVQR